MATSSKVVFKLGTLREKALESIDFRIAQQQEEVNLFLSQGELQDLVAQWRADQEAKISEVFSQLGGDDLSNEDLARFRLDDFPKVDVHELRRAEYRLKELRALRSQIEAKSESLVGDEDGNISLTKTQLAEFFGL
jgi:hypothetical protein